MGKREKKTRTGRPSLGAGESRIRTVRMPDELYDRIQHASDLSDIVAAEIIRRGAEREATRLLARHGR